MSETMQSTDALFDDYTSARHIHALASGQDTDAAVDAINDAFDTEEKLVSRGVSKDKLRTFWLEYAKANGLDY